MGYTWYVYAYVADDRVDGYSYVERYAGQSIFGVIRAARQAKKDGAGCIKIEWRP